MHSRKCSIKKININGNDINISEMVNYDDYLFKICEGQSTKNLKTFSASFAGSLEASELVGELCINLPKDFANIMHERFLKRVHLEEEAIEIEKKIRERQIQQEQQEDYYNDAENGKIDKIEKWKIKI